MNHLITKELVKKILEKADAYTWSIQGFGMLRLYLTNAIRLHVWHNDYKFSDVSTMHNHPWDFESLVIAGAIKNLRWVEDPKGLEFNSAVIRCCQGGSTPGELTGKSEIIKLVNRPLEYYHEGQTYSEKAEEIHQSFPYNGTVTLVTRSFKHDTEHAKVFWPMGEGWVSAEPRPATPQEIKGITSYALQTWFDK